MSLSTKLPPEASSQANSEATTIDSEWQRLPEARDEMTMAPPQGGSRDGGDLNVHTKAYDEVCYNTATHTHTHAHTHTHTHTPPTHTRTQLKMYSGKLKHLTWQGLKNTKRIQKTKGYRKMDSFWHQSPF